MLGTRGNPHSAPFLHVQVGTEHEGPASLALLAFIHMAERQEMRLMQHFFTASLSKGFAYWTDKWHTSPVLQPLHELNVLLQACHDGCPHKLTQEQCLRCLQCLP